MAMTDAAPDLRPLTDVAVGVVTRPNGEVLLAQRPAGKPYAGWWEFPGGKFEPGESAAQAIARELHEELGLTIIESMPWLVREHTYEHARVRLFFRRIERWEGEPHGREGQAFGWRNPQAAGVSPLLPATVPLMRLLSLPPLYGISAAHLVGTSAFLDQLDVAIAGGLGLLQLREPGLSERAFEQLFDAVLSRCRRHQVRLLVNSQHPIEYGRAADGVHWRAADWQARRPEDVDASAADEREHWTGVSCHSAEDLLAAATQGADFAVLGPVKPTQSHPGQAAIGWSGLARLLASTPLPVYALGGMGREDLAMAREVGAHGVAMIRGVFAG